MEVIICYRKADPEVKTRTGRCGLVQFRLVVEDAGITRQVAPEQIRFSQANRDIGACLRQIKLQVNTAASTKEIAFIDTEQNAGFIE